MLASIHAAAAPGATLLLLESIVESGDEPQGAKWMDLHMLVIHGGAERTRTDFERLLQRTGFALVGVTPTTDLDLAVIEARKA